MMTIEHGNTTFQERFLGNRIAGPVLLWIGNQAVEHRFTAEHIAEQTGGRLDMVTFELSMLRKLRQPIIAALPLEAGAKPYRREHYRLEHDLWPELIHIAEAFIITDNRSLGD